MTKVNDEGGNGAVREGNETKKEGMIERKERRVEM